MKKPWFMYAIPVMLVGFVGLVGLMFLFDSVIPETVSSTTPDFEP